MNDVFTPKQESFLVFTCALLHNKCSGDYRIENKPSHFHLVGFILVILPSYYHKVMLVYKSEINTICTIQLGPDYGLLSFAHHATVPRIGELWLSPTRPYGKC